MAFWNSSQREKIDPEVARRERLMTFGRVTEGTILENDSTEVIEVTTVYYTYCVSGADYETSYLLIEEQRENLPKYAPGAKVSVRYDPRQPANSIVV
ncbi:MAG: hypothetical protein H7Z37_10045 [Pyrinomonadaceae bacterium]|nr:hypothetical protein [Pyrinomonadaceae bacterium]